MARLDDPLVRRILLLMPILVSVVAGALAIAVIFRMSDSGAKCWAFGTIGTLIGYWLRLIPKGAGG